MGRSEDKQGDITEHLAELRTRIVRSGIYTAIGMAACWLFYGHIFDLLTAPIIKSLPNVKFQMTGLAEGFMLQMQVCLIAGLIVTAPLITMELWGFVAPGLTREEKRPLRWIAPFSVFLFASGVTLCYLILPKAVQWFALYVPRNAEFRPFISQNLLFVVKMLFAFGAAFELPIALMFLGKLGIINSRMMKSHWRQAIFLTALFAAVATPSNDAFSMLMMAVPMCLLYIFSIFLVRIVEPKDDL